MHKVYLKNFFIAIFALLLPIISINLLIDPFATNNWVEIKNFNRYKSEANEHDRLSKILSIYRLKPEAIAFGSSRTKYGLYIDGVQWGNTPIYNAGLNGISIDEMQRLLAHATAQGRLKKAIFGLDFFMFNADFLQQGMEDFNYSLLSYPGDLNFIREWTAMLSISTSVDTLLASNTTFLNNRNNQYTQAQIEALKRFPSTGARDNFYRHAFLRHAHDYLDGIYFPKNIGLFEFSNKQRGSMFEHFREMVQFCYQHNIEARFYISPSSAWQWEVIDAAGLWPQFEYWKRQLVLILSEEAILNKRPPFPLWDFSGYNSLTNQAVPGCSSQEIMSNYFDASHYKPVVGKLVLDRVLDQNIHDVPKDFGVRITPENINADLTVIRKQRAQWRFDHPDDYEEIKRFSARVFSKEKITPNNLCIDKSIEPQLHKISALQ